MKARRWKRVRLSRRTAIGLAVLGVLAAVFDVGAVWRASRIVDQLARNWIGGAIAEHSGGVYQLDLSPSRFNWFLRRITVDSVSLTTHRALNARRPSSLPGLSLTLHGCRISGVHFLTLIRGGGLVAGSFGCRSGSLLAEVSGGARAGESGDSMPAPAERALGEPRTLLALQQSVRLPSYVPRARIARVLLQQLALDIRLPRTSGAPARLEVERLQWRMADLVIDPAESSAAARPLFSRAVEVTANTSLVMSPDRATAVRVAQLRASLTDSTLEVRGVAFGPTMSGAAFMRSRQYRRDLVRHVVGHATAQGIDFGAFLAGRGVHARRVEVDSLRIDVTADKAQPKDSNASYRTPQQWIASLDETMSLDSLRVSNGTVVYREHTAGRAHLGVLRFARLEAAAANLKHVVGRRSSDEPMTLTARAFLQDAGQIDVQLEVPLDAPRFDMSVRGTLGAMPVAVLNALVVETRGIQIEHGQVAGVGFSMAVRNGVAVGAITPRFNDLAVSVTRTGSQGILGGGGILGGAARGVASLVANTQLRADNPDHPTNAPRVGPIHHSFAPSETIIAFLWSSVRDGLLLVLRK